MEELALLHSPYPVRRSRAEHLRRRHSYAAEVLTLFLAVLDVQEEIFQTARERPVGAGQPRLTMRPARARDNSAGRPCDTPA